MSLASLHTVSSTTFLYLYYKVYIERKNEGGWCEQIFDMFKMSRTWFPQCLRAKAYLLLSVYSKWDQSTVIASSNQPM